MRAVIERVQNATIVANGENRGEIQYGLLIFLGVGAGDTLADVPILAEKILKLRIFSDENGKMNRSILDTQGDMAVVSNFTLYANCTHGNRPDFFEAGSPAVADELYTAFLSYMRERVGHLICGIFGADMQISSTCDGPVTITLDTAHLKKDKGR